ncbi:hypothetical protein [Streptomyces sp. NPDC059788]|uniref:hypothetical protein n=1 Tax=Streptomyces sp. NPDC059788 TaxID=3346948 RepID=UPI003667E5AF
MIFRFRRPPAFTEITFTEPRSLRSGTPGVCFTAVFSAQWSLGGEEHHTPEALVINELVRLAGSITEDWEALDARGAEDALNAALGRAAPIPDLPGSKLSARVRLTLSAQARCDAEQYRADRNRVARLRYLKSQLYSDPEMVLLDHLERHPQDVTTVDIKDYQRLSRSLRVGGQWWYPLLDCLETLTAEAPTRHGDLLAMKLLLRAFKDTIPELIEKNDLQELVDLLLKESGTEWAATPVGTALAGTTVVTERHES